ncbi:hypothetical protein BMR09_02530 [Methylococcaceae bacterium CS3]|nr:hypothetical protein BMR10_05575 [Methylococcaceae bacterium CS4]TXL08721.1 hypothetical protein BMR09_02530 [Methylococcaceae bacterium CS3]
MATTNGSTAIRDKILASLARYRALRIGKFPCAFWRLSSRPGLTAFDEAQTLPLKLVTPTLAALSHLASSHKTSVVFATATQPVFSHLHTQISNHCDKGWQPNEIVNEPLALFTPLERTEYRWHSPQQRWNWNYLAEELEQHQQALCIVNLNRHAQAIIEEIDNPDVLHLSTNQCPAHRQNVLAEVRERLQNKQDCILIATQCIEAGVDIDFPIVYRAYAPLDAIIQAGGRCNREGLLEKGTVHVFAQKMKVILQMEVINKLPI